MTIPASLFAFLPGLILIAFGAMYYVANAVVMVAGEGVGRGGATGAEVSEAGRGAGRHAGVRGVRRAAGGGNRPAREKAMAEHTPGPWTVYSRRGVIAVLRDTEPVINWQGFDSTGLPEDALANARLCAAAPDLLAVCERIVAKDGIAGLRDQLAAAVAKARGAM